MIKIINVFGCLMYIIIGICTKPIKINCSKLTTVHQWKLSIIKIIHETKPELIVFIKIMKSVRFLIKDPFMLIIA